MTDPVDRRRRRRGCCAYRCSTEVFAERGYDGTSMDEIARRVGVSVPVVYDHFPSKIALYRHLLEDDFGVLASIWTRQLASEASAAERFRRVLDAWFTHMQRRAFTLRLLFRVSTADAEVRAIQQDVITRTKELLMPLVASNLVGASEEVSEPQRVELDLIFEILSGTVQSLSLWWSQHPDTPQSIIVETAVNTLWAGMGERIRHLTHDQWPITNANEPSAAGVVRRCAVALLPGSVSQVWGEGRDW